MFGFLQRTPNIPEGIAAALGDTFSEQEMHQLSRFGTTLQLDAGTTLAVEGRPGFEVFVILTGEAEVLRGGEVIATVGPAAVVGEAAILNNEPRNASLVAVTPVETVVFSRRDFNSVLAACPRLELQMRELVAQRAET